MAARVDPMHASAGHQAPHHFVAKAEWSHEEMLGRVCQWVVPKMQLRALLEQGVAKHCVLADAGYGVDNAFRQALTDMGLVYAVGVTSAVVVWPPGIQPLPPKH